MRFSRRGRKGRPRMSEAGNFGFCIDFVLLYIVLLPVVKIICARGYTFFDVIAKRFQL